MTFTQVQAQYDRFLLAFNRSQNTAVVTGYMKRNTFASTEFLRVIGQGAVGYNYLTLYGDDAVCYDKEYQLSSDKMLPLVSSTDKRIAHPVVGTQMFDKTLKRPIWWDGTKWIDASGSAV